MSQYLKTDRMPKKLLLVTELIQPHLIFFLRCLKPCFQHLFICSMWLCWFNHFWAHQENYW